MNETRIKEPFSLCLWHILGDSEPLFVPHVLSIMQPPLMRLMFWRKRRHSYRIGQMPSSNHLFWRVRFCGPPSASSTMRHFSFRLLLMACFFTCRVDAKASAGGGGVFGGGSGDSSSELAIGLICATIAAVCLFCICIFCYYKGFPNEKKHTNNPNL